MTKVELIQSIYDAFRGVKLGDGIGLREARWTDDYYGPLELKENIPEYIKARKEDEREDWAKLLPIFYHQGEKGEGYVADTWSFMDDKGILFHLPCFLLQDVEISRSEFTLWDNPLIYTLTSLYKDSGKEFSSFDRLKILNVAQKNVVIDFLDYKIGQFLKERREDDKLEYRKAKDNFIKYLVDKTA